jgi:phage tail protein X
VLLASFIDCIDDFCRTLIQQVTGNLESKGSSGRICAVFFAAQNECSVDTPDQGPNSHFCLAVFYNGFGIDSQGSVTSAIERGIRLPFRTNLDAGIIVIEHPDNSIDFIIIYAALDSNNTLAHSRQAYIRGYKLPDPGTHSEALKAGYSEDNGIKLPGIQLANPGVDVAAQVLQFQVGITRPDLALPPETAGSNHSTFGQVIE